jgi:WD40 repeat protein
MQCNNYSQLDEKLNMPVSIPRTKADKENVNQKVGISFAEFSCGGNLLLTKNGKFNIYKESQPRVLWIWDIPNVKLHSVIIQALPIRSIKWNPVVADQFAFCCGNGLLYLWDIKLGCDAIEVPAGMQHLMQSSLMY